MVYINPKWVMTEFLRKNLLDPRPNRRPTLHTLTISATNSQTIVPLSYTSGNNLCYIESVSIEGNPLRKWKDYAIDFRNNVIILFTPANLDDEIVIEVFESNTGWIYWDTLDGKLSPEQFPRITVTIVGGVGNRLGNYQAPNEYVMNFQFDVFCKEKATNQIFEIDGKKYTGEELAERLAYDIQEVFEGSIDELHPVLYDFIPSNFPPRQIPFDENLQCHRKIVEGVFSGINIGKL